MKLKDKFNVKEKDDTVLSLELVKNEYYKVTPKGGHGLSYNITVESVEYRIKNKTWQVTD